jgi:hypothetical protein
MVEGVNQNIKDKLSIEHGFFNPLDQKIYYEGDIVPMYQFDSGTAYNGVVIKIIKPGFDGLVKIKPEYTNGQTVITEFDVRLSEDEIEEWIVHPILPDPNCYIIAPEPVAWRWFYAMNEIVKNQVITESRTGSDDDGEFKMEA